MTVDMPEGMIEERMDGIVREYAQYMANQGIRIDDYLKMIGTDMKTFRESMRATAEKAGPHRGPCSPLSPKPRMSRSPKRICRLSMRSSVKPTA